MSQAEDPLKHSECTSANHAAEAARQSDSMGQPKADSLDYYGNHSRSRNCSRHHSLLHKKPPEHLLKESIGDRENSNDAQRHERRGANPAQPPDRRGRKMKQNRRTATHKGAKRQHRRRLTNPASSRP